VILELSRMVGDPVAAAMPWDGYMACLRTSVNGLYAAQRGDLFGPEIEEAWTRLMQGAGMWSPTYGSSEELWDQLQEDGGWWDPVTYTGEWRRFLRNASGRFDLTRGPERVETDTEAADEEFPLLLYPFEVLSMAPGEFVDTPFLKTLSGPHFDAPVEGWVEIHPQVAEELGVEDGDRVRVESSEGAVEVRLRLFEGMQPSIAAMPLGFGRTMGRWAGGWGANPLSLIEPRQDPTTGDLYEYATRVRITSL